MIAGGCEAAITPLSFAGFCSMKAMATNFNGDPTKGSRPFDAARGGFVMGEVQPPPFLPAHSRFFARRSCI